MKKIALLTPAYAGTVHDDHATSVEVGRRALTQAGHTTIRRVLRGDAVLPRVRNHCIAVALQAGADEVVLIDSDIGFDPEMLLRIVSHDAPIVVGAAQGQLKNWRDGGKPRLVYKTFPEPRTQDERGLIEVEGGATAFMKIQAHVFPEMVRQGQALPYVYPGTDPRCWPHLATYFWYSLVPIDEVNDPMLKAQCDQLGLPPEHRVMVQGEDYYFCDRALECGFTPLLDTQIKLRHWEGRCMHDYSLMEAVEK